MSPSYFLLLTIAITLVALTLELLSRAGKRRQLVRLASEWKMHYCADDRFHMTDRVAEMLPVPGAARIRVTDVIYGKELDGYRYVFQASFTQGVLGTKRRAARIATLHEPRERGASESAGPLILAAEGQPVVDQYRELHGRIRPVSENKEA